MSMPSSSSEPNASASPRAQSTSPSSNIFVRVVELLGQLRVDGEALGHAGHDGVDAVDRRPVDAGARRGAARRSAAAAAPPPRPRRAPTGGSRRAPPAGGRWKSSSACSASSMRDVAPLHERLGVELAHRAPGLDPLVHQRLRVARVVALVVAVAPVADHVDHDVLVEPLAVVVRQPGHPDAGLGVVAVHVEDRAPAPSWRRRCSTPTSGPTRAAW